MNALAITALVDSLISQGEALRETEFIKGRGTMREKAYVSLEGFRRWVGNCRVLEAKMGAAFRPWADAFAKEMPNTAVWVPTLLGTLRSINDAVQGGHLESFETIVIAEAFSNLLDQAEHLHSNGYYLAAGVLGRAVLEEELRLLAHSAGCSPQKSRPTLSDLNAELYKAGIYDKLEFKLVESLTAIGNECAHNLSGVTKERVKMLLEQLVLLLGRLKP